MNGSIAGKSLLKECSQELMMVEKNLYIMKQILLNSSLPAFNASFPSKFISASNQLVTILSLLEPISVSCLFGARYELLDRDYYNRLSMAWLYQMTIQDQRVYEDTEGVLHAFSMPNHTNYKKVGWFIGDALGRVIIDLSFS